MFASSLPVEICLAILEFATYTPQPLPPDVQPINPFDPNWNLKEMADMEKALIVKRAVVSVCRQWRTLATPFLYECILSRRRSDMVLLLDRLSKSQKTSERPLGSLVKRFDFSFNGVDTADYSEVDSELARLPTPALLPALLRLLPNLTILHSDLALECYWPLSATDALVDTCAESLQVARWAPMSMSPSPQAFSRLIRGTPNLRFLGIRGLRYEDSEKHWESTSGLHFESLTFLDLTRWLSAFTDMALPSVRGVHLANLKALGNQQFLSQHGEQLTHLALDGTFDERIVDHVRAVCPRLQILEFQEDSWEVAYDPNNPLILPPIRELWIYLSSRVEYTLRYFIDYLASVAQPRLEVVRLLDRDGVPVVTHLRHASEYSDLLAEWRARVPAVSLLDIHGCQISL